jgi:plastocyanin
MAYLPLLSEAGVASGNAQYHRRMRCADSARAAHAAVAAGAAGALMLWVSVGGGCARPPLPAESSADAAPQAPAFLAVAPCPDEAAYTTGHRTVTFGFLGTPPGFSYEPKCLAIQAGQTVIFSGSFAAHPLYPSTKRGTLEGNPIRGPSGGDRQDILFPDSGFFAYFCGIHGGSDDGSTMAGVVWVR